MSDKSSFLNRTTAPSDENRIKSLDMSVVIGDERPTNASPQFNTPQQFNVSQQTNETTSPLMPTRILPIENFPQPIFDKTPEVISNLIFLIFEIFRQFKHLNSRSNLLNQILAKLQ